MFGTVINMLEMDLYVLMVRHRSISNSGVIEKNNLFRVLQ